LHSTAKRQSESPAVPSQEGGNPFDGIIQNITAGYDDSLGASGPFNIDATYGLDDQGSSPFGDLFQELIPATFDGLTGPGNNMSLTGIPGQPPLSIGLGFAPLNGTDGFDFTSAYSQISGLFAEILSGFLGGSNVTTFPISGFGASDPFPGTPGQNATLPGSPDATSPKLRRRIASPLPVPTFDPAYLPFSIPSDVASSIEAQFSSIAVDISEDLPPPTDLPAEHHSTHVPAEPATPTEPPTPTDPTSV
jgi:hypothetical protein